MINILILDDLPAKVDSIKKFLIEDCNISEANIKIGGTIKEGRQLLIKNSFDLLLLDLVMPRDEESDASAEESIKFVNEIYYNSSINIPIHIIGFSQHDDLLESKMNEFEDRLWHLIKFDYADTEWQDKLKNKVCHLISTKEHFVKSVNNQYKFDIGIVCALDRPELSEILQLPCAWNSFEIEGLPYVFHSGTITTKKGNTKKIVACSINRMGMHAAAATTALMVAKFNLKYIFMTGICAGVQSQVENLGNIIIGESALDYGFGKIEGDSEQFTFKPDPQQMQANQALLSQINTFVSKDEYSSIIYQKYKDSKPDNLPKAVIGPIASGSYVVSNESVVLDIIKRNRKLKGVDMEGYGVYLTCHFLEVKALFIKGVCDFADSKKNDDYQRYAAFTSSSFLYLFLIESL